MNERIPYLTQVKTKLKAKFWVPVALGTALQFYGSSVFAQQNPAIAFLSDIHLQEVYADLSTQKFKGVPHPITRKLATIRTMGSQLNSTRLFNENYFALLAALEELAKKGVKLVVLPGDFTDDGQPMNVLALQKILQGYAEKYAMRFFITTGNHDPVSPFGGPGGKTDFLGTQGQSQPIASNTDIFPNLDAAITPQIDHWGYAEICEALANFGFFPSKKDLFWTHPFETFHYESYNWVNAKSGASLDKRTYLLPGTQLQVPDASYLVEPVEGIWLLALDGNTYTPGPNTSNPKPEDWSGSSVGVNLSSKVKSYQLAWIEKIAAEAKMRGKRLISFSHYPLVDFHNGATEAMKDLFGKGKFQLSRVPETAVSEAYAQTGLQVHFAGHMHINQTSLHQTKAGEQLINIQVPSLAAFPPAYKILEEKQAGQLHIQTEILEEVNRMDEFFELYSMEHRWLAKANPKALWNAEILKAPNFLAYTQFHLRELIRLRFINSDWPKDLGLLVNALNAKSLQEWAALPAEKKEAYLDQLLLDQQNRPVDAIRVGSLMEDFYLVKNGGDLGKSLIPQERLNVYSQVFTVKKEVDPKSTTRSSQLANFLGVFSILFQSLPSDDFVIDLHSREIKSGH
ncbi:MAG: metallophosphoesterase [Algoriphagus sp.]|nr:metallophosphoesterase [Algoriphagus sp.]